MNVRAFRGRRCDFKHLIEVIVVWPTVCCAMLLAGCGAIPNSEASDGPPESLVMRVDSRQQPTPTEAAVLAHRILQRESGELLVDEGRRRALAREIEPVLSRIRDAHPAMADITVRQTHAFGELVVTLEPDMSEALSGLLDDATTGSVTLHTGHEEFDALNARLGLSAVELFSSLNSGVFYFNEHLNVYAASRGVLNDGGNRIGGTKHVPGRRFRYRGIEVTRDLACSHSTCVGRLPIRLHIRRALFLHRQRRWS